MHWNGRPLSIDIDVPKSSPNIWTGWAQWKYLYRAVDRLGHTLEFLLTAKRDHAAARRFFERAIQTHSDAGGCDEGNIGGYRCDVDARWWVVIATAATDGEDLAVSVCSWATVGGSDMVRPDLADEGRVNNITSSG